MCVWNSQSVRGNQAVEAGRDHGVACGDLSRDLLGRPGNVNDPHSGPEGSHKRDDGRRRVVIVRDHTEGELLFNGSVYQQRGQDPGLAERDRSCREAFYSPKSRVATHGEHVKRCGLLSRVRLTDESTSPNPRLVLALPTQDHLDHGTGTDQIALVGGSPDYAPAGDSLH